MVQLVLHDFNLDTPDIKLQKSPGFSPAMKNSFDTILNNALSTKRMDNPLANPMEKPSQLKTSINEIPRSNFQEQYEQLMREKSSKKAHKREEGNIDHTIQDKPRESATADNAEKMAAQVDDKKKDLSSEEDEKSIQDLISDALVIHEPSKEIKPVEQKELTTDLALREAEGSEASQELQKSFTKLQLMLKEETSSLMNGGRKVLSQETATSLENLMKDLEKSLKEDSGTHTKEKLKALINENRELFTSLKETKELSTPLKKALAMAMEKVHDQKAAHSKTHGKGNHAPQNDTLRKNGEAQGKEGIQQTSKPSDEKPGSFGDSSNQRNDFTNQTVRSVHNNEKTAEAKGAEITSERFKKQLDSLLNRAKVTIADRKNGSISMRLFPRELGSLRLSIGLEQGVVNGRFTVENHQAKELMLQNLDIVRQELVDAGITVGDFEVNVRDERGAFSQNDDVHSASSPIKEEVVQEFQSSTLPTHDGSINLII